MTRKFFNAKLLASPYENRVRQSAKQGKSSTCFAVFSASLRAVFSHECFPLWLVTNLDPRRPTPFVVLGRILARLKKNRNMKV